MKHGQDPGAAVQEGEGGEEEKEEEEEEEEEDGERGWG